METQNARVIGWRLDGRVSSSSRILQQLTSISLSGEHVCAVSALEYIVPHDSLRERHPVTISRAFHPLSASPTPRTHRLFSAAPPPPLSSPGSWSLRRRIRVHLPLSTSHRNIDKASGVRDALFRAALGRLLLLLGLDLDLLRQLPHDFPQDSRWVWLYLWSLRLDLARTSERAVHFTHVRGGFCSDVFAFRAAGGCLVAMQGLVARSGCF